MRLHCNPRILAAAALLVAVSVVPIPAAAQAPKANPAALFSQVDGMLAALTQITGWEVKREIPSEILPHEEFAKMIGEGVQEAENDKDVRATELVLKMFGLTPWDYNLARESAELIEEQAAAFYDFKKKRLFVLDTTPDGPEQRIALVHELAHALADQHYSLRKYMEGAKTDDAATARQAVVEGQAMWLSWAYMALETTGKPEIPSILIDQLANSVGGEGENFPVLARTPLYIREALTFPYSAGMKFQDAAYRKQGAAAFDALFRNPPESTREILHPERYAASPKPTSPGLPRINDAMGKESRQMRKLIEGDVGEFDYNVLLRQYGDDRQAREIAAHWLGGSYRLYEHKKQGYPMLVHTSEWDSSEAAQAFLRQYREVLRGKWTRMEVAEQTPTQVSGEGDTGKFLLRLDGASVQVIEGMEGAASTAQGQPSGSNTKRAEVQ